MKQPPPPPRKPNQSSMTHGGRSPFTVNGLTVIPPDSPARRRDSHRAPLHPHEHFRADHGDSLTEDCMHQLPVPQAQPEEGLSHPRLDRQWDPRYQYNAGNRNQEGQRSKSNLHMAHVSEKLCIGNSLRTLQIPFSMYFLDRCLSFLFPAVLVKDFVCKQALL